jgi:hypothetical protein
MKNRNSNRPFYCFSLKPAPLAFVLWYGLIYAAAMSQGAGCLAAGTSQEHNEMRVDGFHAAMIMFNDQALRINFDSGYVLESKAPEWQITVFNPTTKTIYTSSEQQLRVRGINYSPATIPALVPPPIERNTTMAGLSVKQLTCTGGNQQYDSLEDGANVFFQTQSKGVKTRTIDSIEYILWNGPAPVQVCHIIQDVYGAPHYAQVPMRFRFTFTDQSHGKFKLNARTLYRRKGEIQIEIPSGYKLCKSACEVCTSPKESANSDAGFKMLLDDPRDGPRQKP